MGTAKKEEEKKEQVFNIELNEIETKLLLISLNETVSSLGTKDGNLTVEMLKLDAKLKSLIK